MANRRNRPKSSLQPYNLCHRDSINDLLSSSSVLFSSSNSKLYKRKQEVHGKDVLKLQLKSFLWRSVHTARCENQLRKLTIEPVRKNLSQKVIRLQAKREEQQKSYQKMVKSFRNRRKLSYKLDKQQFKQSNKVIEQWLYEQKLLHNRYEQRLLKLKI